MKRILALLTCLVTLASAQTSRPFAPRTLSAYQWVLTTLTACTSACYPLNGAGGHDTVDAYFGTVLGPTTGSGIESAGAAIVGTTGITLTFTDGNGVVWSTAVLPAATSGTIVYSLAPLIGMYFANGFSVTCSGGCSTSSLQVYYQR